jgi:hypothetical protein
MNRAGMPYPKPLESTDDRPITGLVRAAAPLDVDTVRAHGYPDKLMNPAPGPEKGSVETYADTLPPEDRDRFYRALRGDGDNDVRAALPGDFEVGASSSGCVGSARRQLYGSVANYLAVFYLPELAQRQAALADQDADVRAAVADFGWCMATRGYRTATPTDAVALAKTYYPDGRRAQAGDEEKMLALADAECRITSRLLERRAAVVDRVVRAWLADNQAVVSHACAASRAAVAVATTVR